jgi:hypothetical protein
VIEYNHVEEITDPLTLLPQYWTTLTPHGQHPDVSERKITEERITENKDKNSTPFISNIS